MISPQFFTSKPTIIDETSSFSGNFGAETQFVGRNKTKDAQIKYYLSKRHTFGKMTMEIQDMEGNTVMELGPGKSKGINIVNWGGKIKQPKVAKGKTFSFGGFTSPTVPAGTYKAVMTKGKETFEHTFELIYDPKSPLSKEERVLKNETTMKMYDMTQELAYLVYELDKIIAQSETDKNTKMAGKLNALKETLVITTGDNYVGSAEPQLREKMADLYSKLADNYDKPTTSELENLTIISERFETAKTDFMKLKKKFKAMEGFELMSFEEFLKSN